MFGTPRRPTFSLRTALLVAVIVPLFGLFALSGAFALRHLEGWIERRLQEDVELVARAIRLPLARAVQNRDRRAVGDLLGSVFRIQRVYGVYVYDTDGAEVAAAGTVSPELPSERIAELTVDGDRRGEYERIDGRSVYSYFVPLSTAGGEVAGLLHVTRRRQDFDEYITTVRRGAVAILLGGVVVITAVSLYGHRRGVGVHVDALRGAMGRVGDGDWGHRAPERGPTELASVARDFNTMLDRLTEAREAVDESERARVRLQNRLRHTEKLAALGQLAAGVAHEMGTPLSVIEGRARRAARRPGDGDRVGESLAAIREEVRRLERIVRQLLDFGRAHDVSLRPTPLAQLAAADASDVRDAAAAARVTLTLDGATGRRAWLDAARIGQALVNLLRNAIDATPGGTVRLSWSDDATEARFTVEDDGPGIPHAVRDRVVEPFFTTKRIGSGTGLGLAIAHSVAEEHGGRLEFADGSLGGARVDLILPAEATTP